MSVFWLPCFLFMLLSKQAILLLNYCGQRYFIASVFYWFAFSDNVFFVGLSVSE